MISREYWSCNTCERKDECTTELPQTFECGLQLGAARERLTGFDDAVSVSALQGVLKQIERVKSEADDHELRFG
jgi:hypothetical protein